ncbi:unnamed protein product [Brachionus calyciflorus]|uniref:Reverse transcriptase domain-containing protein n=1 Tax=Brachionus calyciflorus TaxID=104777 RepID=A0A813MEM2_9BILA|nr:unnamed protein product [Brachionus calyciflorus]
MYADDLLIMTESFKKMEKVLKMFENFGMRTGIKFNPSKTQIMRINGSKKDKTRLELCGEEIEYVEKIKYLGVWVDGNCCSKEHLREKRLCIWRAFSLLKQNLDLYSNKMIPQLKSHLFKAYVRPITYYELENCVLSQCEKNKIQTMEGLMIKQMLGLDKRSRTNNLLYALNIEPVCSKIKKIKLNFAARIIGNEYTEKIFRIKEDNVKSSSKFVQEIRETLCSNEIITQEKLLEKVSQIKDEDETNSRNGICESLKFCLENIEEEKSS